MKRTYEVLYIVKPTIIDEEVGEIIEALANVATENGGNVLSKGKWDRRKLAYDINGYKDGVYCLMYVEGEGNLPAEIYRIFRINDDILRGIVTVVDTRYVKTDKIESPKAVVEDKDAKESSAAKPASVTFTEEELKGMASGEIVAGEKKLDKVEEEPATEETPAAEENSGE